MAIPLFNNYASSTLASPIGSGATSLTLASGGSLFPAPGSNEYFKLVLNDALTGDDYEIVTCTHRAGNVLTITRGQEGTTAQSWAAGDLVFQANTAGSMTDGFELTTAANFGYSQRVDGLIEQWGTGTLISGHRNITFPITFPNNVFAASFIAVTTQPVSSPSGAGPTFSDQVTVTASGGEVWGASGSSLAFAYRVLGN